MVVRVRRGVSISNPLAWEVRKFYPKEYQVSKDMIARLSEELKLSFQMMRHHQSLFILSMPSLRVVVLVSPNEALAWSLIFWKLSVCILGKWWQKIVSLIIDLWRICSIFLSVWLMVWCKGQMMPSYMTKWNRITLIAFHVRKRLLIMLKNIMISRWASTRKFIWPFTFKEWKTVKIVNKIAERLFFAPC